MSKTDVLDLMGLCLIALFAFAVWPPLCLAVFGGGMLLASAVAQGWAPPKRGEGS